MNKMEKGVKMKTLRMLTLALVVAGIGFGQSAPHTITKGSVTSTLSQLTYPDSTGSQRLPLTAIMVCTLDTRTSGVTVAVHFLPGTTSDPVMAPVPTPIPGHWAYCAIGVVSAPKTSILSIDVSELQPISQQFTLSDGSDR
jgi:hypothetical protein